MRVFQIFSVAGGAAPAALSDKSQRAAVLCGCIVAFAYSANYTNHAPLAPALMREFGFNQALAGFLTTGIFATHALMQIPGGHLVDRLGAKRVLLCALAWVTLGNVGMAFAGAYWQLLLCKIFTGIGTGVCFVGGARYVHAAAAGRQLNVAQGLFGGSVQLGAGLVIFAVLGVVSRPLGGILRRHMGIRPLFIGSLVMTALGCFAFVSTSISLGIALTAVVLIGMGVGLPYAAMFSRAGALFPGRAGAAMGLVNMLGITMILGGAPLVGHLADLSGTFRTSFVVLGGFSLFVCAAVPFIDNDEPILSTA